MPSGPRKPIAAANPLFKGILWFVGAITILCFCGSVYIAMNAADPITPAQQDVLSLCRYGFTSGLALFIGLAGGRAGHPDYFGHLPGSDDGGAASRAQPRRRRQATQQTSRPGQPGTPQPPQTGSGQP